MKKLSEKLAAIEWKGQWFPNLDQLNELREQVNTILTELACKGTPEPEDLVGPLTAVAWTHMPDDLAAGLEIYFQEWLTLVKTIKQKATRFVNGLADSDIFPEDVLAYAPIEYARQGIIEYLVGSQNRFFGQRHCLISGKLDAFREELLIEAHLRDPELLTRRSAGVFHSISDVVPQDMIDDAMRGGAEFDNPVDRKKDVKNAWNNFRSDFATLHHVIARSRALYADVFHNAWRLYEYKTLFDQLTGQLTKPLEEYARKHYRGEFLHPTAEEARQTQKKADYHQNALHSLLHRKPHDVDKILQDTIDSWERWTTTRETARITIEHEEAKKAANKSKRLARQNAQEKLAEKPVLLKVKDGKFHPETLKKALQGRNGWVKFEDVLISITQLRGWLSAISLQNGRVNLAYAAPVEFEVKESGNLQDQEVRLHGHNIEAAKVKVRGNFNREIHKHIVMHTKQDGVSLSTRWVDAREAATFKVKGHIHTIKLV